MVLMSIALVNMLLQQHAPHPSTSHHVAAPHRPSKPQPRTAAPRPLPSAPSYKASPPTSSASASSSLADVPGVPATFASCVAERESSNGTDQAYNGGVYGIITASGVNVNGQSVAAQKQAFAQIYATTGPSAWAADGCPGT